jgi:hypothetical protein
MHPKEAGINARKRINFFDTLPAEVRAVLSIF